jgi:hypothetical protein
MGKKRHVLVDRLGLLLHALVTPADVQDRDGELMVLSTLFGQFPFLKKLFADTAYAGPVFQDGLALAMPGLITEIVRRCDRAPRALSFCPNAGSSREQSLGSTAAAASPKIGKTSTTMRSPSYASRPSPAAMMCPVSRRP